MNGKIKPPQYYVDAGLVDYWRDGFLNELARQHNVSQQIMEQLNRAGGKASNNIQQAMQVEYAHGYEGELAHVVKEAYKADLVQSPVIDKHAVEIAVNDARYMSPMSQIKFDALGRMSKCGGDCNDSWALPLLQDRAATSLSSESLVQLAMLSTTQNGRLRLNSIG